MTRLVKANFVNTSCHYAEPPEHGIFVIHMHVHAVSPICISLSLALCMHACIFIIIAAHSDLFERSPYKLS